MQLYVCVCVCVSIVLLYHSNPLLFFSITPSFSLLFLLLFDLLYRLLYWIIEGRNPLYKIKRALL
ncbi:hypothetical protein BDB01DRAFT_785763 [Pilobolus umbonatus]|nr:hypothetical protein BDB01DRAFT_785763 [Pilobolus umbonatus]